MNKNIKYIIEENKFNFNPVDYQDEDPDLIDNQSVSSLTYKYKYFPKNKKELQQIIIKKLRENIEEPYLNDIDTSEIKNMSNLFSGSVENYLYGKKIESNKIKKLDLSGWDVSNVTNMSYMFYKCESLEELNISGWDTSKTKNMTYMFYNCISLETVNISAWNTSNVINMSDMFNRCASLKTLNVSNWDTSNVTDISFMFCGCRSLRKLNVSNWDISNVTDMFSMFYECRSSIIPDWYNY